MDLVLLLWQTAHLQPMVLERAEDVRGLWSSSRPRLWSARRDRAGSQNVAPFELNYGLCDSESGHGGDPRMNAELQSPVFLPRSSSFSTCSLPNPGGRILAVF
jgi:hypothetical protein